MSGLTTFSKVEVMNFVSNNSNFIVKEAHEVLTAEGYRNTWLKRVMTLCQHGSSVEKRPGVVLVFLY